MKKFRLVIALSLPLLLVACGKQDTNTTQQNAKTDQQNVEITQQKISQIESDLELAECIQACETFAIGKPGAEKETCIAMCKLGNAVEANNLAGCEQFQGIEKESCYIGIANQTKDISVCEKVSEGMMRNGCYTSIAEDTKDLSICEKIADPMFRTACEYSVQEELQGE